MSEEPLKVRIKRVGDKELPLPKYESGGAAGMDLRADLSSLELSHCTISRTSVIVFERGGKKTVRVPPLTHYTVPTGVALSIPKGWEGCVRPRSGFASRDAIEVFSPPVDSDYRGEVRIILVNLGHNDFEFCHGDRLAQLVFSPAPQALLEEVEELDKTDRGERWSTSTGRL